LVHDRTLLQGFVMHRFTPLASSIPIFSVIR
jgi:hypothetical protein